MEKILSNYKSLLNNLESLSSESINNYDLDKTGLFIVDMNNGFAKEGALSSPRVEKIINPIADFGKALSSKINTIVAFTDTHDKNSVELKSYPSHCLRGDKESQVVQELLSIENMNILEIIKNLDLEALSSSLQSIEKVLGIVSNLLDKNKEGKL